MSISNESEYQGILKAGKVVAMVRDTLVSQSRPGISTGKLDLIAQELFDQSGAVSAPKSEYNFPGYTCISIGTEAAHGIPSFDKIIRAGDIINIDVSARLNGYYADTGISFIVGKSVDSKLGNLCRAAQRATYAGIKQAKSGNLLRNIGKSMHKSAINDGFDVIRNLAGHGTGRKLHEEPQVLNYESRKDNRRLGDGLVLAIESFITTSSRYVREEKDGWTLKANDGSFVAQYEHTVIVTKNGGLVVTA